jgi:hypothetical protein
MVTFHRLSSERLMFEITHHRWQHHPNPHPEEPRVARRLEGWATGEVLVPILRDALRAPQDEEVRFIDGLSPFIFGQYPGESMTWRRNFFPAAYKP